MHTYSHSDNRYTHFLGYIHFVIMIFTSFLCINFFHPYPYFLCLFNKLNSQTLCVCEVKFISQEKNKFFHQSLMIISSVHFTFDISFATKIPMILDEFLVYINFFVLFCVNNSVKKTGYFFTFYWIFFSFLSI